MSIGSISVVGIRSSVPVSISSVQESSISISIGIGIGITLHNMDSSTRVGIVSGTINIGGMESIGIGSIAVGIGKTVSIGSIEESGISISISLSISSHVGGEANHDSKLDHVSNHWK